MWPDLEAILNGAVGAWELEHRAVVIVVLALLIGVAVLALVPPKKLKAVEPVKQPGWKPLEDYSGTLGRHQPETANQMVARLRRELALERRRARRWKAEAKLLWVRGNWRRPWP